MGASSEVVYSEKPAWISFDDIHNLLWKANGENRGKGFILSTSHLSGEQLQERLGEDGKCFVAVASEDLIGTASVRFLNRNTWFAKGRVADYMLIAVDPDYQGKHVLSALFSKVDSYVSEQGCNVIELDTAENNIRAINIYKHFGYKMVSYKANPGGDHYSVIMAKWVDNCPYSDFYCNLRFIMKKFYIRARFKPDRKKRFFL